MGCGCGGAKRAQGAEQRTTAGRRTDGGSTRVDATRVPFNDPGYTWNGPARTSKPQPTPSQ
jgi:hypothetical protein